MTPQEVLTRAADHMEKVGLYKGDFYAPDARNDGSFGNYAITSDDVIAVQDRPCCAIGAIYAVTPVAPRARVDIEPLVGRATSLLVEYLDLHDECDITDWNDASERTQEEVVAALRAASQLEENA